MLRLHGFFLIVFLMISAGCTVSIDTSGHRVVAADVATAEVEQQAKSATPPNGTGLIYLVKPDNLTDLATDAYVFLDGIPVRYLTKGTYYVASIKPGRHRLVVWGYWRTSDDPLNFEARGSANDKQLMRGTEISIAQGKTYFFATAEVANGYLRGIRLDDVPPSQAREIIANSHLSQTTFTWDISKPRESIRIIGISGGK